MSYYCLGLSCIEMDKFILDNIKIDFLNVENKILSMLWFFIFLIELFV